MLHEVDGQRFLTETVLAQEVFGPSALLVNVKEEDELLAVAHSLKGQLSAAASPRRRPVKAILDAVFANPPGGATR